MGGKERESVEGRERENEIENVQATEDAELAWELRRGLEGQKSARVC